MWFVYTVVVLVSAAATTHAITTHVTPPTTHATSPTTHATPPPLLSFLKVISQPDNVCRGVEASGTRESDEGMVVSRAWQDGVEGVKGPTWAWREGVKGVREPAWALYLPVHARPDSSCGVAVASVLQALTSPSHDTMWALRLVDSWAKVPDGFLFGDPFNGGLGDFDGCVTPRTPPGGRYCYVTIGKQTEATGQAGVVRPRVGAASVVVAPPYGLLSYATCVPAQCLTHDVQESLAKTLDHSGRYLFDLDCQAYHDHGPFTPGQIAMVAWLSVMVVLVMVASVVDVCGPNTQHTGLRVLLAFSAYSNTRRLLRVYHRPRQGDIFCLHGIRVLTMTWVVLGHQYSSNFTLARNFSDIPKRTSRIWFQLVGNAYVSTDTFLFVSGLLVALGVLGQVSTQQTFRPLRYYLHRVLRLSPCIAMVSLVLGTVFVRAADGPFRATAEYYRHVCSNYWWRDALFVNNLIYRDDQGQVVQCLGQCWYTSLDTQLYVFAPLLLLPLARRPSIGKFVLVLVTGVSLVIPGVVIYTNGYPPTIIHTLDPSVHNSDYTLHVYLAPWCRCGSYLVGVWTGYFMHTYSKRKIVWSPMQVWCGWIVATLVGLSVLLGMYDHSRLDASAVPVGEVSRVLYGALHRPAWCAALAWLVLACHYGYAGPVNDLLSHPSWQVMSRLTFATYLVAVPVQTYLVVTVRDLTYLTTLNKVLESCGVLVLSLVLAVALVLLVEAPVMALERLFLPRPNPDKEKTIADQPGVECGDGGRTNQAEE